MISLPDPAALFAMMSHAPSLSFTLPDFDPIVHIGPFPLQLGPLAIRWYALAYLAGIGLGWFYAQRLLKQDSLWQWTAPPLAPIKFDDLILWLALGVILGGRLFYVFVYNLGETLSNPLSVFTVWNGGMSFHGGFLGVCVAGILYARAEKLSKTQILNLGDILATVAPIGLGLGRLANFINGELWGRPTDVSWGVVFCNAHIRAQNEGTCGLAGQVARHPSQLYEAGLEGVVLLALTYFLGQRFKLFKRPGLIWGAFMVGYGLSRMALEQVRNPDPQMPDFLKGYVTMGLILSLPMVLAGAWLINQAIKAPPLQPLILSPAASPIKAMETPESSAPLPEKTAKRASKPVLESKED